MEFYLLCGELRYVVYDLSFSPRVMAGFKKLHILNDGKITFLDVTLEFIFK